MFAISSFFSKKHSTLIKNDELKNNITMDYQETTLLTSSNRQAFVTIVIGEKYKQFYNKSFRTSHERFAKKHKIDFIVLDEHIDQSSYGKNRHPSWQKLLVFKSPLLKKYDQICFFDADIYITHQAQNPFNFVQEGFWGMVKNNPFHFEHLKKSDVSLFDYCPLENRPTYVLNGGFFILDRKTHSEILSFIYKNYPEQNCYEQGPLSYHLLSKKFRGVELDTYFNCILSNFREKYIKENGVRKVFSLAYNNGFIHFCGGIDKKILTYVKFVDTFRIPHFLTKKIATLK